MSRSVVGPVVLVRPVAQRKPDHADAFGIRHPEAIVFRAGKLQRQIIWQRARPLLDRDGTMTDRRPIGRTGNVPAEEG